MLIEKHEGPSSNFIGTIIDIETIGEYCSGYAKADSRVYKDIKMVIFGYINRKGLHIYCARGDQSIRELEGLVKPLLSELDKDRPLTAFQCHHEMGVCFHHLGLQVTFDNELQFKEFERKEGALRSLGIFESYGDPFHNKPKPGLACMQAWLNGDYDNAVRHNRACLSKEEQLLMKRGSITPLPFDFRTPDSPSMTTRLSFQPWKKQQEDYIKKAWGEGKNLDNDSASGRMSKNAKGSLASFAETRRDLI